MSRILHTADWHLGARLIDHDRSEEHGRFLDWLLIQIRELKPNLLIVAGDVFDSTNPPQQALRQYYQFLAGVSQTETQVLVVGGNHDSALTLNAPRDILRSLRIHVVGSAPVDHREALVDLGDAVICAVPYLRERDVRKASAGQSSDEVAAQLRDGIVAHYRLLFDHACEMAQGRPVLATGHLAAVGGRSSESERSIQIGNLGAVPIDCFAGFTYIALGHLHRPQMVGGRDHIRYSGAPVALGFDEADGSKHILEVTTSSDRGVVVTPVEIPCFRRLLRLNCPLEEIAGVLSGIVITEDELIPWLEISVEDGAVHPDLDFKVRSAAEKFAGEILKVLTSTPANPETAEHAFDGRMLTEIKPEEVFAERLRREGIAPETDEGAALAATFSELLTRMQDHDEA